MIQDGGFGNKLTIEDGAVLELERFEYVNGVAVGKAREPTEDRKMESERASPVVSPGVSDATTNANISADNVAPNENNSSNSNSNNNGHRRRFSHFHFRRLNLQRRVSGPALAVVDAERNATSQSGITPEDTKAAKNRDGDGVRVTIRLVALDEQSMELDSPNEQLIYLHIVRESTKSDGGEDDAKPWVVKVVKREAAVGFSFWSNSLLTNLIDWTSHVSFTRNIWSLLIWLRRRSSSSTRFTYVPTRCIWYSTGLCGR